LEIPTKIAEGTLFVGFGIGWAVLLPAKREERGATIAITRDAALLICAPDAGKSFDWLCW
jgi:hypothetical protein